MENNEWMRFPKTAEEFWEYCQISYEHEMVKDVAEIINEMELPADLDLEDFYAEWERRFSKYLRNHSDDYTDLMA